MNSSSLIIFDLDGTLVDSAPTVLRLLNQIRGMLKLEPIDLEKISHLLSHGGENMVAEAIGSRVNIDHYLSVFRDLYVNDDLKGESLFPGVLDYLEYLKDHKIKIAICSNKPEHLLVKVLGHHQIDGYFDAIIGAKPSIPKKPSPESIKYLLNKLNIPSSEAILIGDSRVDQQAAQSAGIKFCFFEGGYDDGVFRDNIDITFKIYKELTGNII
jgi:phosphoglycolate phosphatase